MKRNKIIIALSVALMLLSNIALALSTADTDVPIIGAGKDQYGRSTNGAAIQTVGINSSGKVSIDKGAVGTVFGGTIETSGAQTITGATTYTSSVSSNPLVKIVNTNAGATGAELRFQKDSASPADNDDITAITFYSDTDSANAKEMARILVEATDVSTGSEDAAFDIDVITAGTEREYIGLGGSEIIFNEDKQDIDFRYENTSTINGIVFDYGTAGVGINKVPASGTELDVNGDISASTATITTINAFTLGGKLTAGAIEVEGTNFDINGGYADGITLGSSAATTLNFTNIKISPAAAVGTVSIVTANRCVTVNISGTNYKLLLYQ